MTTDASAIAKQIFDNSLVPLPDRQKLYIELPGGLVLRASWFDCDNLLAGVVVQSEKRIPLLDQRLGNFNKSRKWVEIQTREQACDAMAHAAIRVTERVAALTPQDTEADFPLGKACALSGDTACEACQ